MNTFVTAVHFNFSGKVPHDLPQCVADDVYQDVYQAGTDVN